jgi:hypothetical protein
MKSSSIISICKKFSIAFFVFALVATLIYVGCSSDKPQQQAPPKSDKELYFEFYNNVLAQIKTINETFVPFDRACAENDVIKAIGVAADIESTINSLSLKLDGTKPPTLNNKEAEKELAKAADLVSASFLNKNQALSRFIEYSKNPAPYTMAEAIKLMKRSESQLFLGLGGIMTTGGTLGLTLDEIKKGTGIEESTPSPDNDKKEIRNKDRRENTNLFALNLHLSE